MNKIILLTHIYYDQSYDLLRSYLLNFKITDAAFLFSVSMDCGNKEEVISRIKADFPAACIIETPNIGKDIGGKLALIDLLLKLNMSSDYLIFLHDKLSPQALNGNEWRTKLFKIAEKENINTILDLFAKNKTVGMIADKESISSEYSEEQKDFITTNRELLKKYILKYNIETKKYEFSAGSMFWVRTRIVKDFFSKNSPLEIRKNLEPGNVLDRAGGTHTHTMERMFGLINGNKGYTIYGI